MVQASDLLLMTDLKSLCCQFLESCITAENCIGIRLFSLHYCLYHVHYAATEFLQTHFGDVALTEEFRELPPDRLCEVLAMEKLNVGNEKHVLEAVVRWLAHDPEDRRVGDAHFRFSVEMREVMKNVDGHLVYSTDQPLIRKLIAILLKNLKWGIWGFSHFQYRFVKLLIKWHSNISHGVEFILGVDQNIGLPS